MLMKLCKARIKEHATVHDSTKHLFLPGFQINFFPFLHVEDEKSMDKSLLINISCAKVVVFFHSYPLLNETTAILLDSCISYVTFI